MHPYRFLFTVAFLVWLAAPAGAQSPASNSSGAAHVQLAEERFKNIQALKGTPADEVFPTMQFIAASLGKDCEFCHVKGKFESDDKRPKLTARKMIAMTMALNKENFKGRLEVSCYSCHRGAEEPIGVPPVQMTDVEPPHSAESEPAPPTGGPAANQIIEKYLAAVGGADALHKIHSRVETGTIEAMGHASPIEVFAKAPDKRMSVTRMPGGGENITAFDGAHGWMSGGPHPAREMSGAENVAAGLDAELYFPARLKEIFTSFRVGHPEDIDGHKTNALFCMRPGQPAVRLYFDQSSGLLLRELRYAETPIGRNPTEIDYADYRESDGVKIPFRWTLARPNGRFTIQIQEAKNNVAIDDAKFAKPPAPAGGKP